ncbi:hypothetical protein EGW08_019355 [Elysia chlorotica]|uniref:Corticotropin-releasing factor domain-containing protein n=1 Tax=Elysia chlorotica TaxID=188477 RepID=A0A3S1B1Q5_ELYCH|nr:hypothetical protein EGW08_019355 [Elysia chlorotica]
MIFAQSGLPLARVTLLVSILSSVFAASVAPVDSQTNSGSEVTDHAGRLLSQPPIGLDRLLSWPPIGLDRLYSQPPIGLDRLYSQPPIGLDRLLSQSTRQAERESSLPDSADTGSLLSEARRQTDGESDRLMSRVPRPEDSTTDLLHSTDKLLSEARRQIDGESNRLISRGPRPEGNATGLLHSTDRLLSPASSQVKVDLDVPQDRRYLFDELKKVSLKRL